MAIKYPTTLRSALLDQLSEEELANLRTSFDIIGDIAIMEIPDKLIKKEKIIAKTLLNIHKNLKTVVKKADIHQGVFRTQKVKLLAGKRNKTGVHKENGCMIKLNVEKVYFSPRMSTERKRILEQVKPGEEILVMFSGCAPYPCVLAKNTKAKEITGIEINPQGHMFGLENIKLNKISNVKLINADVNQVMPLKKLGLKGSWMKSQLMPRIKKNPQLYEIYLKDGDLENDLDKIKKAIEKLDMDLYLHQPCKFKDRLVGFCHSDKDYSFVRECYDILENLCIEFANVKGYILHPEQYLGEDMAFNFKTVKKNMVKYRLPNAFVENSNCGYYKSLAKISKISEAIGSDRICVDLVHLFVKHKSTIKMINEIKKIPEHIETYFHVADSSGIHDALALGQGRMDLQKLMPLVNKGVLEIINPDENNPVGALTSYDSSIINKKFDRILMPLPKGGEDYLELALKNAGNGTILHFYDFLHEDQFNFAEEKVAKACKSLGLKFKIISLNRCGQHAPRVYRICLDVKIIAKAL